MQKTIAILMLIFIVGYAEAGTWTELDIRIKNPEINEVKNVIFGIKPYTEIEKKIITYNVEDKSTREYPVNDKFEVVKSDLSGNYWALVKTKSENGLKSTFMLESSEDLNWWKGYTTTVGDYDKAFLVPSKKFKNMVYLVGFTSPFYYDVIRCGINDRVCIKLNGFQITDTTIDSNDFVSTKTDRSNEFITLASVQSDIGARIKYYEFSPYTEYAFKKTYDSMRCFNGTKLEGEYLNYTSNTFVFNLTSGAAFKTNPNSYLLDLLISQLPFGADIISTGSPYQRIGIKYDEDNLVAMIDTPIYLTTGEFIERQLWEMDQDYNLKFIATLPNGSKHDEGYIFKIKNKYIIIDRDIIYYSIKYIYE